MKKFQRIGAKRQNVSEALRRGRLVRCIYPDNDLLGRKRRWLLIREPEESTWRSRLAKSRIGRWCDVKTIRLRLECQYLKRKIHIRAWQMWQKITASDS